MVKDKTLLTIGGITLAGIVAYFLLKSRAPPLEYPKIISRDPYAFFVYNEEEETQMKDFLGISPTKDDLDTYLSELTQTELLEWKNYWIDMWTNLDRTDMIEFVYEIYEIYYVPEPEPNISFLIKDFYLNPPTVSEGDTTDWVTLIENTGVARELNCSVEFFYGEEVMKGPWWKIYMVGSRQNWIITIPLVIGTGWSIGDYDVVCRLWTSSEGGTKVGDLDSIGEVYEAGTGTLTGLLDEKWITFKVI